MFYEKEPIELVYWTTGFLWIYLWIIVTFMHFTEILHSSKLIHIELVLEEQGCGQINVFARKNNSNLWGNVCTYFKLSSNSSSILFFLSFFFFFFSSSVLTQVVTFSILAASSFFKILCPELFCPPPSPDLGW